MSDLFTDQKVVQDKKAKTLSFFVTKEPVTINTETIDQLVNLSKQNGNCNARICLHSSPQALFHEMIILEYHHGRYYRPHKHAEKEESCHMIRGEVGIFVFDEKGKILQSAVLTNNENPIFRIGKDQWHTVVPLTEYAIYHESKPGPFLGENDSIYPSWAPDGKDSRRARAYIDELLESLGRG